MESVTSNDSGMASNLSEDGGSRKTSEVSVTAEGSPSHEGNNNSLPKEVSYAELELLKKLEEQNRYVMFFFHFQRQTFRNSEKIFDKKVHPIKLSLS